MTACCQLCCPNLTLFLWAHRLHPHQPGTARLLSSAVTAASWPPPSFTVSSCSLLGGHRTTVMLLSLSSGHYEMARPGRQPGESSYFQLPVSLSHPHPQGARDPVLTRPEITEASSRRGLSTVSPTPMAARGSLPSNETVELCEQERHSMVMRPSARAPIPTQTHTSALLLFSHCRVLTL